MTIQKNWNGKELTVAIEGRVDTTTAPELEKNLMPDLTEAAALVLDMTNVAYISSAGLRVLLSARKRMGTKKMVLTHVKSEVMEVFEVTGFTDILTFA